MNYLALAWNIPERVPIIAGIILGVLSLFIWIYFWNRKKKRKRDKNHALRRMREDALDRALANPMQNNNKSIEMQRRPFQVEYSKGDAGQNKNNSEKMFQLTEITELSERKYMFLCRELISIGNQFGSTAILSDVREAKQIDCQIYFYEGANYVRSMGRKDIILKRREKKVVINDLGIKLLSKDSFVVDQTTFRIDFL